MGTGRSFLAFSPLSYAADIDAGKGGAGRGGLHSKALACHKPLDKVSYTFTLKQIAEAN
jgi:hypothetical protein